MVASLLSSPPRRWTGCPLRGAGDNFLKTSQQWYHDDGSAMVIVKIITQWWISDGKVKQRSGPFLRPHQWSRGLHKSSWGERQSRSISFVCEGSKEEEEKGLRLWICLIAKGWLAIAKLKPLSLLISLFLSDPSPIIGNACHSLPNWLTNSLTPV